MAQARSAREGFGFAGPLWLDLRDLVGRYFPDTERVRRLLPLLLAGFAAVAILGFAAQIISGKRAAFAEAEYRLDLIADATAANLKDKKLKPDSDWQKALADSLPRRGLGMDRVILLADAEGNIEARAPLDSAPKGDLVTVLGPQQPLTTFGAEAGVLRLTLFDGTDALVAVRNVGDSQLAFIQPVDSALADWRQGARLEITLLVLTGLVLALLACGLWSLGPVSARAERSSVAGDLAEALTGCGVWRWNLARGHVHWSAPMYRLLGLDPSDKAMAFGAVARALHPEDDLRGEVDRHLREDLSHFDRSFRLRHADGHWVTVRLRGEIARGPDREPYLTGIAVAAENADTAVPVGSADENARLRDAVETISEAFVLWDRDNRLVMCNSKYQQFHGLSDDMVRPGSSYDEVIAGASEPIVSKRVSMTGSHDDDSRTYEAQIEDGRWLHINERRTRDGGYVSVGTDITVLKQSQQRLADSEQQLRASVAGEKLSSRELEQQKQQLVDLAEKYALEKNRAEAANRAKSEFLANISHELRTPLNAVIGFSEVMTQSLFGPVGHPKYQEYARDILASGNYLLEVINDILDMSKIEAGRMSLDVGRVDLADIVADSMKVVSQAAAERNIGLSRHGPQHLPLEADRRALKQVFLNLLSNAVKFTRDGGSVDVHLARTRGYVKIAIRDTGIGIADADIVKLGRPFEQVENQFSKSHQGSGLGLAISRALVELHGGTLRITSREGQGTTVTCMLPLQPVIADKAPELAAASA
ncbi:MAG TPA: ATP-binding protein [Methyloceanibacter sp.]|nr:ATP-binding protein [Methyloceanibacter sp.]